MLLNKKNCLTENQTILASVGVNVLIIQIT